MKTALPGPRFEILKHQEKNPGCDVQKNKKTNDRNETNKIVQLHQRTFFLRQKPQLMSQAESYQEVLGKASSMLAVDGDLKMKKDLCK